MRVLIAGQSLCEIGGVQNYERDLAAWLLSRGFAPVVYATELGEAASKMHALTIPVTDDLATITAPIDIIHGDSAVETVAALLRFPDAPAVFVCHGWESISALTPRFPRILRYVAVDDTCAERLITRDGIAPEQVSVLLNTVDVEVFRQRDALPVKPGRALVFGNLAHELTFLSPIREACRRASIELDVAGAAAGSAAERPESLLGSYDVVFAKAKCAMEAMACGAAVVLCGDSGLGGMVRSEDFDRLRRLNFGIRTLRQPLTAELVEAELARYDASDARAVSDRMRESAAANDLHAALLATYEAVIEGHAGQVRDWAAESRAASAFLHDVAVQERYRQRTMWTMAKASQRVLRMPGVGPVAQRALRWLTRRR